MSEKVAVIYSSATGNTEAMAEAVAVGAKSTAPKCFWHRFPMWILWKSETPTIILSWAAAPGESRSLKRPR